MAFIEFENIFHSSGDNRRIVFYDQAPELLSQGILSIRREPLRVKPVSDAAFWVGGGHEHKQLATLAAGFLLEAGETPAYEVHYGKRVDVSSTDGRYRIECGDTDGNFIYDHLANGCDIWAVIPFQDDNNRYIYIFERGPKWDSYKPPSANDGMILDD